MKILNNYSPYEIDKEQLFEAENYMITPVLLWNVKTKAVCPVQTQRVRLFIQQYHNKEFQCFYYFYFS